MKPLTEFVDRTSLTGGPSFVERTRQKLKLLLGRFVYSAYQAYTHYADGLIRARSLADRLNDQEIETFTKSEIKNLDVGRKERQRKQPVEQSFQGMIIPLVESVLQRDPAVKSVVDLSARYAFAAHELAVRNANLEVVCVSMAPNAVEYNAQFNRPNLTFVIGYALDLLEQGKAHADVAIFSSMAVLLRNRELRRYLRCLAQDTRYIVLNEPVFNRWDYATIDPNTVSLDQSLSTFEEQGSTFIHNYRAMLKEAGFEVLHYHIFPFPDYIVPKPGKTHVLHLIAQNSHIK